MREPRNNQTILAIVVAAVLAAIVLFVGIYLALGGARGTGMPIDGGFYLQESATPVMEELTTVYNIVSYIIAGIVAFVVALMAFIMIRFRESANPVPSKTSHNTLIEIVWTIVPVILLLIIAVPSMQLLYFQDRLPETEVTVKAVGNTWHWEYEYPQHDNIDSYVSAPLDKLTAELDEVDLPYLLATDAALVVPVQTKVKVLVTSVNNMHSWAMPSFGIKMDAVPGIINETWFEVRKEGVYYGQCSEICGIKHYYMPIEVQVVSKEAYAAWIANDGAFPDEFKQYRINKAPAQVAAVDTLLD